MKIEFDPVKAKANFQYRGDHIRVISARKATKREVRICEAGI